MSAVCTEHHKFLVQNVCGFFFKFFLTSPGARRNPIHGHSLTSRKTIANDRAGGIAMTPACASDSFFLSFFFWFKLFFQCFSRRFYLFDMFGVKMKKKLVKDLSKKVLHSFRV